MASILQGSLKHFPMGELLSILRRHSGTLDLEGDTKSARVAVAGGMVIAASSSDPSLDLVSLLSTYGLMTKEELDSVASGSSTAVTEQHRSFHASEIVFDVFTWGEGSFRLHDEMFLPGTVSLPFDALIEAGTRRAEEQSAAVRLYPDDLVAFRVVDNPPEAVSLNAEEFKVLFRIGQGRTLRELQHELRLSSDDLYPVVHGLENHGLIRRLDSEPGEATVVQRDVKPAPKKHEPPPPVQPPRPAAEPVQADAGEATAMIPMPAAPSVSLSGTTRRRSFVGSLTQDQGEVYALIDDEYVIGREPGNSISIPDGSISSRHAKITRAREGFFLEDLDSRNGTFVNGEKISERRLLVDNDLLRLGKIILTFNLAQELRPGEETQPEKLL